MRLPLPAAFVALTTLVSLSWSSDAQAKSVFKKAADAGKKAVDSGKQAAEKAAEIATAPVRAPIELGQKVVNGDSISPGDVVNAVSPELARLGAASKAGLPGAAEAEAIATAPVNLALAISNIRKRTEEAEEVLHNANEAAIAVRDAAKAGESAAKNIDATTTRANELLARADALEKRGSDLIAAATEIMKRVDPSAPDAVATMAQLNKTIELGNQLVSRAAELRKQAGADANPKKRRVRRGTTAVERPKGRASR
jgi:hypothetical protein